MFSSDYNDVYFSREGGMAETAHVFLDGCGLTSGFDHEHTVIAETGFGTGLNFLMAWKLFQETRKNDQTLDFISFEKHPLNAEQIQEAHSPWLDALTPYVQKLCAALPLRVNGVHPIRLSPHCRLILVYGDVNDTMPRMDAQVDHWFLDGFTPAKNPDMWSPTLFYSMARMSHSTTHFSTFTAASMVKQGLSKEGFHVEKAKGFGQKRDMLVGHYTKGQRVECPVKPDKIAILGGGLAGLCLAHGLEEQGVEATLFRADEIGGSASGNRTGMMNPKLSAKPTPHSDYYASAYAFALQYYQTLQNQCDIEFQQCGSLHLQINADKERRFNGYIHNLGWHPDHIMMLDTEKASEQSGIRISHKALFYPDAVTASPARICAALSKGKHITNKKIDSVSDVKDDGFSEVMLASGTGSAALLPQLGHALSSTRGQVSHVRFQAPPQTNICFGGYATPADADGVSMLGATFQPWESDPSVRDEDHAQNIENWRNALGDAAALPEVIGGWTGFRSSSKDRFPVVGTYDGLRISTAHASHGLISAPYAAEILISELLGHPIPAFRDVLAALSPARFIPNLSTD